MLGICLICYTAWNPLKLCWDYVKLDVAMLRLYMLEKLEARCARLRPFEDNPAVVNWEGTGSVADSHHVLKSPELLNQILLATRLTFFKFPVQKGCENAKRLKARPGTNCTNLSTA